MCRQGQRYSLLVMLQCDLTAPSIGGQMGARVQARSACEYVVVISAPAGCPINDGPRCSPNCPRTWLADGECDPGCDTPACDQDGGDCSSAGARTSSVQAGLCAPGCAASWRGDRECDEECNNEACAFDGGDCAGVCAPGCAEAWLKDGVCDDECNTASCSFDGGDCLRNGRPVAQRRCAWGCPSSWLADGQCDLGCNVTACGFDHGDCVAAWKHDARRPNRQRPGGPRTGAQDAPLAPAATSGAPGGNAPFGSSLTACDPVSATLLTPWL